MTITISPVAFALAAWALGGLAFLALLTGGLGERVAGLLDAFNAHPKFRSAFSIAVVIAGGPIAWILLALSFPERSLATVTVIPGRVALFRGGPHGYRTKGGWITAVSADGSTLRIGTKRTGLLISKLQHKQI